MGALRPPLRRHCRSGPAGGAHAGRTVRVCARLPVAAGWRRAGRVRAGFTVLVASVRHKGRSLAEIARTEISPFAGLVAMIAVLFILLVTLAGLGIVVVNALANSPWGVFTIGATVPIALIMGIWMFKSHAGKITVTGPSIFGVVLLISAVIGGHWFAQTGAAGVLTFTPHQITFLMMA